MIACQFCGDTQGLCLCYSGPNFFRSSSILVGGMHWQPSFPVAAAQVPISNFYKPDPRQPDTLGWREWMWDEESKMLRSPSQGTLWPEAELMVPDWSEADAVRGVAGIHAHLVPKHWKIMGTEHAEYVAALDPMRVHGVVERFGKYVLGTEGWRAEWVVIKELMAPSTKIGLEIEQAYPDVIVHYPEEEGDTSCELVKSSALGKGNRSTSRPLPLPHPPKPSLPVANLSLPMPPPPVQAATPSESFAPPMRLPTSLRNRAIAVCMGWGVIIGAWIWLIFRV